MVEKKPDTLVASIGLILSFMILIRLSALHLSSKAFSHLCCVCDVTPINCRFGDTNSKIALLGEGKGFPEGIFGISPVGG